MYSQSVEKYLKTVYALQQECGRAETATLAEHLGVTMPSVTQMLKKLARLQLVVYIPYQGVVLTEGGYRAAQALIRRHQLIELYLAQELGLPWEDVQAEAKRWEHAISKDLEDRMEARLGHPNL